MKRPLYATILLLCSSLAFSQTLESSLEFDVGISSPNKGLVGARFYPMPSWSAGIIWGSVSSFADFGIAGSYHFSGISGAYIFQSHHWLNADKDKDNKNIWEICTGGGYQRAWRNGILAYVELGIPLYIGDRVYRNYKNGAPTNIDSNGDMVLISFRTGAGIGYKIDLF
ncbi:MAG: hypothetical protein LBB36_06655 [Fibromonadaceae bacterium]|jgi:hypothetical protein|nr:hypothetical protein [Fibromonadaceae bacterium]